MPGWETIASHVVLAALVVVMGLVHRSDLKRITIEFKNGKDKTDHAD